MGKDKKEKNPADAFRKEQRKKELLKLKKDREVVREVRDLLNDPKKIDEEIIKAQKISDENKLDKSLKDRIKELQRMRDVANTRQLVLAAQGKKSLAEAESITKPSIYQSNAGVWDDPSSAKNSTQPHVKSASRVSTEGLPAYARSGETPLASQMPLPTSVMLPYPPALVPNVFPRGPIMGGMGGIPLPPPRPSGMGMQAGSYMMAPPPPPPRGPPGSQHIAHIPPPPPYGMPMGAPMPMMAQGYYGPGQPMPMQQMYGQVQPPQGPRGAPRPWQAPAQRKPRPAKHQAEEIDPLDPAGQGYTERFGAANTAARRLPPAPAPPPSSAPSAAATQASEPAQVDGAVESQLAPQSAQGGAGANVNPQIAAFVPPPPPPKPVTSFGPVLSAEDLMRRRLQVPSTDTDAAKVTHEEANAPAAGPAMNFGAVLSAEEIMHRRHLVTSEPSPAQDISGPASGPALPPPGASFPGYGTVLTAEELMRRRYQVPEPEEAEDEAVDAPGAASYPPPGPYSGPSLGPSNSASAGAGSGAGVIDGATGAAISAEELMRRRYEIPEVVVEDVDSDHNSDDEVPQRFQQYEFEQPEDEDQDQGHEEGSGDVSEDEVRSAGMADTQEFDESEFPYPVQDHEDEEMSPEDLERELNMRNLYPARLPASFTALPQPVRPPPSAAPAPAATKSGYSAISNFNDYGDDSEDEQENEEDYYQEPAPKIQPYAHPATATAVLPPSTSSSSSVPAASSPHSTSYEPYTEGNDISRAMVKGPKIVKTDRALTAFVPNALKKKRMLTSGSAGTAAWQNVKAPKLSAGQSAAQTSGDLPAEDGGDSGNEGQGGARSGNMGAEDLHLATSALLRGSVGPAFRTGNVIARPAAAPIAFVPASSAAVKPAAPMAVPSAEEDAFAQFFQEINQL